MKIAVDFDGTVVTHEYPRIGKDVGAVPVLRFLIEQGHDLILYTMRSGQELEEAVSWYELHNIPLYGIQCDPNQKEWTSSPKCYAQLYIDDAALGAPLMRNQSGQQHIDWDKVKTYFKKV